MTLRTALLSAAAAGCLATTAFAAAAQPSAFWNYPAIHGYGPEHVWPGVVERPQARKTYKALFDLTQGKAAADKVNPGLDHIARTVNIFAGAGVPLRHLRFAVIIHGPATPIVLGAAAYQAKFGHPNPNLALIAALRKAGVRLMVCGNALGDMHLTPAQVNPDIHVALSALSTVIILQDKGYALVRM
jgi:intracellular sulfur oxidation DsrE/DsrF family protein